ncbi:hypothetical protein ACFLYC_00795 [Chloroflexota bacterium]
MPSKSRHGRRKHSFQSTKKKSGGSLHSVVAQQPAATQTDRPVVPQTRAPAPTSVLAAVQHPYILPELKRIGILAGIMVIILVVLAIVLS